MKRTVELLVLWSQFLFIIFCSASAVHTGLIVDNNCNKHEKVCKETNGKLVSNLTATGANLKPSEETLDKLVDDYSVGIFMIVQYCFISTLINIFGIATNIINIVIFIKQGFGDSINISLLGLSISDLCSLIALQWGNVCFTPFLLTAEIPFDSSDVAYLTAGWPRIAFTRITAWITAFITFEKCLCITMPLKVKMIITPRRTLIAIVSIFLILIGSLGPTYYTSRLVWKFDPLINRSRYGLYVTDDREEVDSVTFALSSVFLPVSAFIIVVVCTGILALELSGKSKWRTKLTSKGEHLSKKDKRVVKMVSFISTIFIISFLPNAINFTTMAAVPEFNIDGKYRNLFIVTFSYCFILESVNSSINIFLYMQMSAKFRETFNRVFPLCSGKFK